MRNTKTQTKFNNKRTKQNGGITLIALVITIIVLLILAGVSIATLTGENGILTRANDAKVETEEATAKEKVQVEVLGSYGTDGKLDLDMLKTNIEKAGGTVTGSTFPVKVTMDGYEFTVYENGNVTLDGENDDTGETTGGNWNGKVNTPKLAEGMIPIKWDSSKTSWVICSETDPDWYNYTDQVTGVDGTSKWANVMLSDGKYYAENSTNVNKEGKEPATINTSVEKDDLGSMFVWIPRYAYEIDSLYNSSSSNSGGIVKIAFLEGTNTYNTGAEIKYSYQGETGTAKLTNASGEGNWNEHPAFNYGGTIIPGIWVAKFEASSSTPSATNGGGNVTNLKVKVLPGVTSWRYITIGNSYTNCVNMNSSENASYYGISSDDSKIDPHLLKNNEWGAVAYLTQSSYGRNGNEVTINNSSSYITGSAGNNVSAGSNVGTTNDYTDTQGVKASTTGNTTGIYDMSGGAWERVAGYVNNGNSSLTSNGQALLDAPDKHKQIYTITTDSQNENYNNMATLFGDAVYETSSTASGSTSWFGDYSYCPSTSYPFFLRGGYCHDGSNAGVFYFGTTRGGVGSYGSFRPSVVVF